MELNMGLVYSLKVTAEDEGCGLLILSFLTVIGAICGLLILSFGSFLIYGRSK